MHHVISHSVSRSSSCVAFREFSVRMKTPPPLEPLSRLMTLYLSVGNTELFDMSLFSYDSVPMIISGFVLSIRWASSSLLAHTL